MKSLLIKVTSFVADLLLWFLFVVGLVAATASGVIATASGVILDGTAKNVATYGGIAVSLVAGSLIARKPKIKAFLSTQPVLWFLFLFNGAAAVICYFAVKGTQGIMAAVGLGVVSIAAGGGLIASRRKPVPAADRP